MEITKTLYNLLGKEVIVEYSNKKVLTTISIIENNEGVITFVLSNGDKIALDTISSIVHNNSTTTITYNDEGLIVFKIV
jgi:hypothetical protein